MSMTLNATKNVGASKAAKGILGSMDRRLTEPAGIVIRFWGWILLISILYLFFYGVFPEEDRSSIALWFVIYGAYLAILEVIRKAWTQRYDSPLFRAARILFNLFVISLLINIAATERFLLVFAYTVPIFAAFVYFAEQVLIKVSVLFLALLGIYLGGSLFAREQPLSLLQFSLLAAVLLVLSSGFEVLRKKVTLVPGRLTEVAKELHKTLDLQQLLLEIMEKAVDLTQAPRGLIIIINPRNKQYMGHLFHNFNLRANCSVEELAKTCFALAGSEPFEGADVITRFSQENIYQEFFDPQPQAVIAEPLFNRAGQIMGVVNVAHDHPDSFDRISKSLLKEFAFLVSNAIENCLEHRQVKLREARSREVGDKFVSSTTEDEVVHTLIEEVRQQIPHVEKLTLHRYLPKNKVLVPICSFSSETTPKFFVWSDVGATQKRARLRLGHGVAGRALELHETISVPSTGDHPWYVRLEGAFEASSLIVAPLFDSEDNELYGTLSLENIRPNAFNLEDETILTNLSTQASLAIAKIRDFQGWREEGGILRRMLEQIRSFDTTGTEETLCQQISDAAVSLLGYKVARIRILSRDNQLVTTAVSGVSARMQKRMLGKHLALSELTPFLQPIYKAGNSYLIRQNTPGWKEVVDKYFYKPRQTRQNRSSWGAYDALLTPLLDPSGNILGILTLDVPDTDSEPNKQTLELIGVFADAAGWVIELGRFQKRIINQQNRTQSFIDSISQELAKGRDINTICEVVVQVGVKLFNTEGCSLYFVSGNQIVLKYSNFLAQTDFILRHKPISTLPKSGLTSWVAATGEVLCFNHQEFKKHPAWAGEERHLKYLPSQICQSLLLAPIKDKEGRVIGVITLENKKGNTGTGLKDFDEKDRERVMSLANEFAKALETIGLYEDIREWERTGLAEDLHDLMNWYHSGVIMWIDAIEEWLRKEDISRVRELLPELRRHAYTTVYELKTLHTNVLSKSLEAGTFKQALFKTLRAWESRALPKYKGALDISMECPETLEVPVKLRNTLIRIASLAFSNAIQHSGILEDPSIKVILRVEQIERDITLAVIDTGRGIDFEKSPPGFGFDRMRQLTEKINTWGEMCSTLQIRTATNQGTQVLLHLTAKPEVIPA